MVYFHPYVQKLEQTHITHSLGRHGGTYGPSDRAFFGLGSSHLTFLPVRMNTIGLTFVSLLLPNKKQFVSLLKVTKCESLFLNQVFVDIKSCAIPKSKISSPVKFFTLYPWPHERFQNPNYLFQHVHSVYSYKNISLFGAA